MIPVNDPEVRRRLEDIKTHPERHHHSYEALTLCCMVNGAIDMALSDAHEEYASLGTNGGRRCDVTRGPCSCGAWH
jgi:hypothetical protein